jgi:hypothetical protein
MIIWGKKKVEKTLGYVAELCPICRAAKVFRISRVGVAGHIYFIPMGEGELADHIGQCQECGTKISVNPTKYQAFEQQSTTEIERLIQSTFPIFRSVYAERLEILDRLKKHKSVPTYNRHLWLMEPFECLAVDAEERYANARFDKESGIGCVGTMLLLVFLICGSSAVGSSSLAGNIMFLVMGLVVIVGPIYTLVQVALAPNRYVQRSIIPRLAKSLSPLNPGKEEITQCLSMLQTQRFRIGRKINPEKLWQAIQKNQAPDASSYGAFNA